MYAALFTSLLPTAFIFAKYLGHGGILLYKGIILLSLVRIASSALVKTVYGRLPEGYLQVGRDRCEKLS